MCDEYVHGCATDMLLISNVYSECDMYMVNVMEVYDRYNTNECSCTMSNLWTCNMYDLRV